MGRWVDGSAGRRVGGLVGRLVGKASIFLSRFPSSRLSLPLPNPMQQILRRVFAIAIHLVDDHYAALAQAHHLANDFY